MTKLRLGGFMIPSTGGSIENVEKGLAGTHPAYYQNSLRDIAKLSRQMDELGFDFVGFTEHHFHIEGMETSNNPVLLGSFVASVTEKLRLTQLGSVITARNPILVAEDLAMLDHFSGGRVMPGFARGYQSRHVMTLGQKNNAYYTVPNDPNYEEHDSVNRELFTEHLEIIRKAWKERTFSYQGKHWTIPPPGINWDHPMTRRLAPETLHEDGTLKEIGLSPNTLQDPDHIEMTVPFTMSQDTIEWAAAEGAWPILLHCLPETVRPILDAYHKAATESGRKISWGDNVGHFREIVVADTEEEAREISRHGMGYVWNEWHDWFGFQEVLRRPGEDKAPPNTPETLLERGISLCGTVDTVARGIEDLIEQYNAPMVVSWIFQGLVPVDSLLKSNDLLVEKVLPKVGVELERFQPVLRPEFQGGTWKQDS